MGLMDYGQGAKAFADSFMQTYLSLSEKQLREKQLEDAEKTQAIQNQILQAQLNEKQREDLRQAQFQEAIRNRTTNTVENQVNTSPQYAADLALSGKGIMPRIDPDVPAQLTPDEQEKVMAMQPKTKALTQQDVLDLAGQFANKPEDMTKLYGLMATSTNRTDALAQAFYLKQLTEAGKNNRAAASLDERETYHEGLLDLGQQKVNKKGNGSGSTAKKDLANSIKYLDSIIETNEKSNTANKNDKAQVDANNTAIRNALAWKARLLSGDSTPTDLYNAYNPQAKTGSSKYSITNVRR